MRTETMNAQNKVVKTKLFIGNLDPATETAELKDLFASFGNVLEASVIKDYGFVHYGSVEEAEKAVAALNNKEFHGKRLRVELSTSTVRHRPGQPEPTSSLKSSRTRPSIVSNNNSNVRYGNNGPQTGSVGPIRHGSSNWARQEARPYGNTPRDFQPPQQQMAPDYSLGAPSYDRPRPYDQRPEPGRFYPEVHEEPYPPPYDAPAYPPGPRGPVEPAEAYGNRPYRDAPPHHRIDNPGYGPSRYEQPYDRHPDGSPGDPYYDGSMNSGPHPPADSYNYDSYQKYYPGGRQREPEYHGAPSHGPPMPREYDSYSNYRQDPYSSPNGQGSQMRGNHNVGHQPPLAPLPPPSQPPAPPPQQPHYHHHHHHQQQHQHQPHQQQQHQQHPQHQQHQGNYPSGPVPSHRQQPMYGSGSSAGSAVPNYQQPVPPHHYYGAHHRH